FGYEVQTAYDGAAALQAAEEFEPDAVLLDIGLPELDGFQVARALRNGDPEHRRLIVAVTGYGTPNDRRQSRKTGFDLHLIKPADPVELKALLAIHAAFLKVSARRQTSQARHRQCQGSQ